MAWGKCLVLCLMILGSQAPAQILELSREQAISLARQAWLGGDLVLAEAIAGRIVAVNGTDVEALLLLAAIEERKGHAKRALDLGRRAWAASRDRPMALRHEIANLTASAAYGAEKPRLAALWLGRALATAPDAERAARTTASLRAVRRTVPLTFSGGLAISPTDNLNDGATSGLWAVDDLVIGGLSGWSLAQPGLVTTAQLGAAYTWGEDLSANRLTLDLDGNFHQLDPDAARANPTLDASDLDLLRVSLGWSRALALGADDRPGVLQLETSQSWYGGRPYARALRLEAEVPLSAALTLDAVQERQWTDGAQVNGTSLHLKAARQLNFPWGKGRADFAMGATLLRGDEVNATYDHLDASLVVDPGLSPGGISSRFGLSLHQRTYKDYALFANVFATNGRSDKGVTLTASFNLDRLPVAGMTPTLTLQRQIVRSNISKYQNDATRISFGLAARF